MLELGLKILFAYLLGSLSGAMLVGRAYGGVDIRGEGSGNAGGTNALRTHGVWFALWVVIIDVGKGMLAVGVLPALVLPGVSGVVELPREWIAPLCGAAAVLGHCYPVFFNYRGGKGAATLVGTLAILEPSALGPVLLTWLLVLTLSGFVGLSTMLAAAAAAVYTAFLRPGPGAPELVAYTIAMAGFIVFTHRLNIKRMREGAENRQDALMLLRRFR